MNNENKVLGIWTVFMAMVITGLILMMCLMFTVKSNATSLDKNTVFKHNGKVFETGSFIHNGRIFVPLRMLSEKLGYKVEWNGKDKTIGLSKESRFAQFKLNSKYVFIYNSDPIVMDVEPMVIGGSTFIPVRYAVESLEKFVEYYEDEKVRVINITDNSQHQDLGGK